MSSINNPHHSSASSSAAQGDFVVGDFTISPSCGLVTGPQGQRHLEPKVMALLVRLAAAPEALVSRQTLLDSIWPDTVVGDHVLTRAIYALRQALADPSSGSRMVQTVSKRGYRLLLPVKPSPHTAPASVAKSDASISALPTGAALAVLPLQLPALDGQQQFLGAGIARDLTALLALIPGLRVVGSVSVEQIIAPERSVSEIAAQLGARYVVSGSLEVRAEMFRLRAELVDTATQEQLWAQRYDAKLAELFAVQDEIVQAMARSLSSALALGSVQHLADREPFDLDAYEHLQLAEDARRHYNRSAAERIVHHLESALAIQSRDGVVHAMLAMQLSQNLVSGWASNPAATAAAAASHLQQALAFAPNDSRVLMAAGISALMRGEHLQAMGYLQRSLERNPNESHTLAELGTARFYVTRELQPSINMFEAAERAAPNHPRYGIWAYRRGICHYEAGDTDSAVAAFDEAIARMPTYGHVHFTKAVALAGVDRDDEAIHAIAQGAEFSPGVSYADYEAGVLAFGLTIPKAVRQKLSLLSAAL